MVVACRVAPKYATVFTNNLHSSQWFVAMEKTRPGSLGRLVAWFRRSTDNDVGQAEITLPQSRIRRSPRAERVSVDPMQNRTVVDPMRKDPARPEPAPVEQAVHGHVATHGHTQGGHAPSNHAPSAGGPVQVAHGHAHGHAGSEHKATEVIHIEYGQGEPVAVEYGHGKPVVVDHGHGGHLAHADQGHDEGHGHGHGHGHAHHDVLVAKGTGGRLELHGNTLHLTKGGLFGFFVGLLGLHGGHAHQTIRVSDISAIEFEKHGVFFHYVRFCYPGAPSESGNHLHDMMADNALLMSMFDNRGLYRIKEKIEQSMEAKGHS